MRERRKVVTVLFCDLVGSTDLGESTDPEVLRARLARAFADLRAVIERHGGTVEKFVGDAVMAVFGIPTAHEDDALRAVRAACDMRAVIAEHGLEARIGVNTGEVVTGGEGETLVTGDAVNVAARLEQAAAAGEVLFGERTHALVRDAVRVERVGPLVLKGKSAPVPAFRLLELVGDMPVARRLDSPLVGRERERERLWRAYEDAVADRSCQLFTLLGPAGIGKSRLVADFLDRVGGGADVLRGRCLSYGEGITYWPLVEMVIPLGVEPSSVISSTPAETQVGFRKLLEARAVHRPQVVVVDDLQWAEPLFVDLVEHVADLSRAAPIFLLCIARTELLDSRPEWGGGKLNATSLLLEPLGPEECERLIGQLLGGLELSPEARARIMSASGGNALFVEEMVAMMREGGVGDEITVPPTIHAVLQARIDSLDATLRLVLERAAVEGEIFHRDAVAALASDDGLDGHLAMLVRKELIRPEQSLLPGLDAYRFRHLLIRDAAYGAMPKTVRASLHARLADWLERSVSGAALELDEILGYHLEQAYRLRVELGDDEPKLAARAGRCLVGAGRRALGHADYPAAVSLLQRAADLLPEGEGLAVLPDLAHALNRQGKFELAATTLRRVLEAAPDVLDHGVADRARLALSSIAMRTDRDVGAERVLAEARAIAASATERGDLGTLARALETAANCEFQLGRARTAELGLEEAIALAARIGDLEVQRSAMSSRLRPVAWGPMPAEDGIAYCTTVLESELANVADRSHALQVCALLHAMRGDVDASRRASDESWALKEEFGLTVLKAVHAADIGYAEELSGDLERAEAELRRGHDLLVAIGEVGLRATVDPILASVVQRQGRDEEADQLIEECRGLGSADDFDAQSRWRAVLARVLARRGDLEAAEELAREAVAIVEPTDFIGLQADTHDALGHVLSRAERRDEARGALQRAIALHEQKGNVVAAARSRRALDEFGPDARS
ncbi:MAG TPA: adenylate/guanylate cyclase domain-containing protein [Gaiellaceae bacterium]|nr:adenylate/guanylate cyclase domain-containing protein [Gaiellaceae bacterium]